MKTDTIEALVSHHLELRPLRESIARSATPLKQGMPRGSSTDSAMISATITRVTVGCFGMGAAGHQTIPVGSVSLWRKRSARSMQKQGWHKLRKTRARIAKWAVKSERAAIAAAVLKLAPSEPAIAVTAEALDCDVWSLNVQNGTLDLRTGELREHRRKDLLTMIAPVVYTPHARAPLWESFVGEVLPDPDVREFAQTLVGYALTGDTTAQIFPIAFGAGQNGKTTFFQTLRDLLGDYAGEVSPDVLMVTKFGDGGKAATPQIAKTAGSG